MGNGFQVDPGALGKAAEQARQAIDELRQNAPRLTAPSPVQIGHDGLNRSIGEFTTRWEQTTDEILRHGDALAENLSGAGDKYSEFEHGSVDALRALLTTGLAEHG